MLGVAVTREGVDGYAAARSEDALDLDITRIHQLHEVVEDDVHTVFMKVAVIPEREQVQLEALALDHLDTRNIRDDYLGEIRLPGLGAERRELRAKEGHEILAPGMLVDKRLQHLGSILCGIADPGIAQQSHPIKFIFSTHF